MAGIALQERVHGVPTITLPSQPIALAHHLYAASPCVPHPGVITAASLLCPPRPASTHVAFLACPTFQHVTFTLQRARARLGDILSACEFMDQASVDLAVELMPSRVTKPLQGAREPFYMLIET